MFGSKLDLFKKEWLEVVFEDRNKEYGAYELRKNAYKATNIGLLAVVVIVTVISLPKVFGFSYFPAGEPKEEIEYTEVTLEDLDIPEPEEEEEEEPIEIEETPPQRIAEEPPAQDLIRFPDVNVADAKDVKEEIVSQEEIKEKNATPARLTLKGTPGATGVPTGEFGPKKVEGAITGSTKGDPDGDADPNKIFTSVAVEPEYPGGMAAFRKYVETSFQYPSGAIDAGVKGAVELTFVVEKDGSLTDIKVLKDLGYGTGQAGVNLLKRSKKWKPGIQNGRPVRVQYRLPISLNLQN
ncbi:energy transducer TonB [Sphingobacterium corticibacter]|uniref:Energy transducer TonB n=1 Tax=Sphingobacterium corticibacter TaxID=2171749 RepID=A0A2T8HKB8_9SPHI|nr:energy transducer TonB [Sphingobacterium corticibacter]PVH25894.1 energy transducer TonB [Sphingobacterium corticibacter]